MRTVGRPNGAPPARAPAAPEGGQGDEGHGGDDHPAGGRPTGQHDGHQGDQRADGERQRRDQVRLARSGQGLVGDAQLLGHVHGQDVALGQLDRHLVGQAGVEALVDVDAGELAELALGWSRSSPRSLAMSARSVSRCELTEPYSPTAIDTAPATRAATPAVNTARRGGVGGGHADDQRGGRDDAVVGAQHRGAQPPDPVAQVALGVRGGRGHGHQTPCVGPA